MTSGTSPRSPFLVVLDVDSTLIEDEVIELIADYAGVTAEVARVTERAMAGELNFEESLRHRVALLEGVSSTDVASVVDRVVVTNGVPELIDGVHAAGGRVGVVSGGFHELLDPLAQRLGLDFCRANRLETADGRLTGRVDGDIVDAHGKAAALEEWAAASGIPLGRAVAVGDGANDLEMLGRARLGVAFCAKPVVRERADVAIDTPDLSAVLPLLGLRG